MILVAVARETPFTAQIPGIGQIMCSERVLCFLNYLRKSDRSSTGLVSGLQAIPPEGGRPRQARCFAFALSSFRREAAHDHASCLACAHFPKTQVLMLARKAFGLEFWRATPPRVSSCTTARLQRQEYRLQLKRPPPIRRAGWCPPFKSSTLGLAGALAFSPFCAVSEQQLTFPFWKEKLRLGLLTFLSKTESKRFLRREGGRTKCDGPTRRPPGSTITGIETVLSWNIPSI
jgi:hypothetical protein